MPRRVDYGFGVPEGDVVLRTAQRLHEALAGQALIRVELRWGDLDGRPLVGNSTTEVAARGKHILQRIEGGWTLHSHLRMEGSWRIARTGAPLRGSSSVRAIVADEVWTAVGSRLGMLDLLRTRDEHRLVGHLGPDILGPGWDEQQALTRVFGSPVSIGEALLDQRNLAGIGTLYCSESLFLEHTFPWASPAQLGQGKVSRIIARARRLMEANLNDVVQSTTGSRRRGEEHYVHARSGRPCRRCGDTIRVAMIGPAPQERTMFSCPTCQGGHGPTDDGRPQRPLGVTPSPRRGTYPRRAD